MRRENPNEFWERMRSGRPSTSPPPDRSPGMVREPGRSQPGGPTPSQPADRPTREPEPQPPPTEPRRSNGNGDDAPQDAPVGDLVKQLTDQTKTLVKQEIRLAQVELQEKGKKMGVGAGLFGGAGLVALFGAATLIAAIVLALSTALAAWLSALIVAVVLLAIAGVAALKGKKEIEQATPPVPEQTVETVKEDVEHVKERARR